MSASFDLAVFVDTPTVELLNVAKKSDLLDVAKQYYVKEIKPSMRKHEVNNILIRYFVDEEVFDANALDSISEVAISSSNEFEMLKL